jgi:hypothetical protein
MKLHAMANSNNRRNNKGAENEGSKQGLKARRGGMPNTTQTGGQSGGGTHRTDDKDLNEQGSRSGSGGGRKGGR